MADVHRLNPNAMLVLLGTAIYAVVGGAPVTAGGVIVALFLAARHRRQSRSGGGGPISLFGPPVAVEDGRRSVFGPYLRAIPLEVAPARR